MYFHRVAVKLSHLQLMGHTSWLSNINYQNSFIHNSYILCIENMFETWIYKKMQNLCDICSFIGLYFIHQHIHPCVKRVFNAWYLYAKCANYKWMNFAQFSLLICCSYICDDISCSFWMKTKLNVVHMETWKLK